MMNKRNAATMMAAAMTLATVAPAFAAPATVESTKTVNVELAKGRNVTKVAYDLVYNTNFTADKKDDTLKKDVVVLQVITPATTNVDGEYLVSVPFTTAELTEAKKVEIAKEKLKLEEMDAEIKHNLTLKFVDAKGVTKDLYTMQPEVKVKANTGELFNRSEVTLVNNQDPAKADLKYVKQNVTIEIKEESPAVVAEEINLADADAKGKGYRGLSEKTFELEKTKDITIEKSELNSTTLAIKAYKTDANKTHVRTINVVGYDKFNEAKMVKISGNSDFANHWAETVIFDAMYDETVALSTQFRPNDNITRAEFIKIVNKTFGYTTKAQKETFADVDSNNWFYDDVLVAINAKYINGYEDGTLRPNQPITRQEASAIVAKIVNNGAVETTEADVNGKLVDKDIKTAFKDDKDIAVWADESVEFLNTKGIIKGYADNTFKPLNSITRAEALTIMSRAK